MVYILLLNQCNYNLDLITGIVFITFTSFVNAYNEMSLKMFNFRLSSAFMETHPMLQFLGLALTNTCELPIFTNEEDPKYNPKLKVKCNLGVVV